MRTSFLLVVALSLAVAAGCGGGGVPTGDTGGDPGRLDLVDADVGDAPEVTDTADAPDADAPDGRDVPRPDVPADPGPDVEPGDETPVDPGPDGTPVDVPLDTRTDTDDGPRDPGPDGTPGDASPDDATGDAGPEVFTCRSDLDCEGRVELASCQVPACDDGTCVAATADDGTPCDDASLCTKDDKCQVGECLGTPVTCVDDDPCTTDGCLPATGCQFLAFTGPCDDHDACTVDDACRSGFCGGTARTCNDDNACTTDGCDKATGCTFTPLNSGACDDGDACSKNDRCQAGRCRGDGGCDDDNACTRDTCIDGTGCAHENLDGTSCNDGDPCSADDHCAAGVCVGTHSCDDNNPCTTDECTATGCVHRNNTDACDDGNLCTVSDKCQGGSCQGTAYTCTAAECEASVACDGQGGCVAVNKIDDTPCTADASECTRDVCIGGACAHPAKTDGTPCSDGTACTRTDACLSGVCVGTNPVVCPEPDPCKAGSCDPATGTCSGKARPDGSACDDGNRCTQTDTCQLGQCRGTNPVACGPLDQCHVTGACDTVTGLCSNPAKGDGSYCDDHDLCTRSDSCQAGSCVGADPVVCPVPDTCHEPGVCNPSTGSCTLAAKADGTPCSDTNLCTKDDKCTAGRCGGTTYACNDGLFCTTDACDGAGACSFTPKAGYCAIAGTCFTVGRVNPANSCEICTPTNSAVAWSPNPGACDDGNACTTGDACTNGTCTGTPYSCDDGIPCTDDACDGIGGCMNTLKASWCRIDGTCLPFNASNPANTCQRCWPATSTSAWSPRAEGDGCDDGNLCTANDVCSGGTCGGTPYTCNDGLACTQDGCTGEGGCEFVPLPGFCQIDNACVTEGTANPNNVCQACQREVLATGWSPAREGLTCDDGDSCTENDFCLNGACTGGVSLCTDGLGCTRDRCLPAGGCAHDLLEGWCVIGNTCYQVGEQDPANDCQRCDPLVSTSTWAIRNGSSCNDQDPCTDNDTCMGATCAGTAKDCSDGFECTNDTCQGGSCLSTIAAGWCKIDGLGCYRSGDVNPHNPCQRCDPTATVGLWSAWQDGVACDDGNPCTSGEACDAGACLGTAYSCNDGLLCTADSCDGLGGCVHAALPGKCVIGGNQCQDAGDVDPANPCLGCDPAVDPEGWSPRNGVACDDGTTCTQGDVCLLGACAGVPYTCDDGVACTRDSCDGSGGCTFVLMGSFCRIGDTCWADQTPHPTDPCLACVSAFDTTTWSPRDGVACTDGNPCTVFDLCGGGTCQGAPYSCDDGLSCTADACDGLGGCTNTQIAGTCLIAGACFVDGDLDLTSPCRKCNPAASATEWSPRNGVACNDGDACSTGDTCDAGQCKGTPYSCDDSDPCTFDACNGEGGCSNPMRDDVCRIDGVCMPAGTSNPSQRCLACVPATSQSAWTPLNPNAIEICNDGVDDNCDGITDPEDSVGCVWHYRDDDSDGYGVTSDARCLCARDGAYRTTLAGDCDDTSLLVNPSMPEVCNTLDDNCDGLTDPEDTTGCLPIYRDVDGDGRGVASDVKCLCGPTGSYRAYQRGDCDDNDATVYLGAPEICDGKDNDCNNVIDPPGTEDCKNYYVDADGDGYGPSYPFQCRCAAKAPYLTRLAGDCDDTASTLNPGRTDICNGLDDDCNGTADDAAISVMCPIDAGVTPHGSPTCTSYCVMACDGPTGGAAGWYDADGNTRNGCECQGDAYESANNHECAAAVDLGTLNESAAAVEVLGNLTAAGQSDWFKVTATDDRWDAETDSCDHFSLRVRFLDNPSSAFGLDIRRDTCDGTTACSDVDDHEWSSWFYQAGVAGECNCTTAATPVCNDPESLTACLAKEKDATKCNTCPGVASPSMNACSDGTRTVFVRVFRRTGMPSNCDAYRLELSNGKYPWSGG